MSLAGVWVNEYGSKMDLGTLNDNLVTGTYQSSTGSTGTYMVIGLQQTANPTPQTGQAVALAIEWHSIAGGPPDNSWHWVSGLSGQISLDNGADTLVLSHALIASDDFPGLAEQGTYIDKLIYRRAHEQSLFTGDNKPESASPMESPIAGTWRAEDGTVLMLQVYPYTHNEFGWIQGTRSSHGQGSAIYGVTDINAAAGGLRRQSVAITALPTIAGPATALSGTLDLDTGELTLLDLSSHSTAPDTTYIQTQVSSRTFMRIQSP